MNRTSDEIPYYKNQEQIDAETMWDQKAAQYNASQKRQGMTDSRNIADLLHQKKQLMYGEVLDVGGGAGLYAIPFASYAKHVTITDISSNMLSYAQENATAAGLSNLKFQKLDWNKANLKKLGWEHHFDLVYSSMCPAIKYSENIDKMMDASKKWCCINRYIKLKDSVAEEIEKYLHYTVPADCHNNRKRMETLFHYLWEKEYDPEVSYYEETVENKFSVDEALVHYDSIYHEAAQNQNVNLKNILSDMAENQYLKVSKYKKMALLSWKA